MGIIESYFERNDEASLRPGICGKYILAFPQRKHLRPEKTDKIDQNTNFAKWLFFWYITVDISSLKKIIIVYFLKKTMLKKRKVNTSFVSVFFG